MQNIILCGCSAAEHRIAESLTPYARVEYMDRNVVWKRGESGPELLVSGVTQLPRTDRLPAVLVLGSMLRRQKNPLSAQMLPVFDASSAAAARLLASNEGGAISCGTSPKDTFSLASFSEQKAVVSLQRDLPLLTGGIVESGDFTVRLCRSCSVFELMAFCAVLLLSGAAPGQELKLI